VPKVLLDLTQAYVSTSINIARHIYAMNRVSRVHISCDISTFDAITSIDIAMNVSTHCTTAAAINRSSVAMNNNRSVALNVFNVTMNLYIDISIEVIPNSLTINDEFSIADSDITTRAINGLPIDCNTSAVLISSKHKVFSFHSLVNNKPPTLNSRELDLL
jgi:hypothetical protein